MTPETNTTARLLTVRHVQVVENSGNLHLEWEVTGKKPAMFRVRKDGRDLFQTNEPRLASKFYHAQLGLRTEG